MMTVLAVVLLVLLVVGFVASIVMAFCGCLLSQLNLIFNSEVWVKLIGACLSAIFNGGD